MMDVVVAGRIFGGERRKLAAAAIAAAMMLSVFAPALARATDRLVPVIVRAIPGWDDSVATKIQDNGGRIERRIGIIDAFIASIPASHVDTLRGARGIYEVTPDAPLKLLSTIDGYDSSGDPNSMFDAAKSIRATDLWKAGVTGKGIDVALIDSGVAPVDGLTIPWKVINGPDLSFESQNNNVRYLDTYGHGTHMAGIIAGLDDSVSTWGDLLNPDKFVGIAPGARIVNMKVANAMGATDVSQVLAAIDWVVQHKNDNGLNIRVLNLSFGTDSEQSYVMDPLAYAAEVAWRHGIVVVVAAGNNGASLGHLNDPAVDPYVIAVGADDSKGTNSVTDDAIPSWSSRGNGTRNPDVVAPGKSIQSLRDPNSYVDSTYPGGVINSRFFRGSGTSQAAAMVSGSAALLLSQRPSLTPDQIKGLLNKTAMAVPGADATVAGNGFINLKAASNTTAQASVQSWQSSSGLGTLEGARGSAHVMDANGNVLSGEQDIFGNAWNGTTWSSGSWNGTTWSGGNWNGTTWSGTTWSGTTWSGTTWSGTTWSGTTWSGTTWSGITWTGTTWSGTTWSGITWSGTTWSGTTWAGTTWASSLWGDAADSY